MKPYRYEVTKAVLQSGKVKLRLDENIPIDAGWKDALLTPDSKSRNKKGSAISLKKGDQATVVDTVVEEKVTTPPPRLSSGKLIEAMENPHRFETDAEVKKLLKEGDGIGTPATRSDGIKRAFQKGLIVKSGKVSKPSKTFSKYADDFELFNPGFTAILQRTLNAVSRGSLSEKELFVQNENIIREMVNKWSS